MPLFNFRLRPLDDVAPPGTPDAPGLSWSGLTGGSYWIELGGQQLLRARDGRVEPPAVDSPVARLWEDLLEITPAVLAPLPADLAAAVSDGGAWAARVAHWQSAAFLRASPDHVPLVHDGLWWWYQRSLLSPQLVEAPEVTFWTDGGQVHARWHSQPDPDGRWAVVAGETTMPVDEFVNELKLFHVALFREMNTRVRALLGSGGRPGVALERAHLGREQLERAAQLDTVLDVKVGAHEDDWEAARRLLATA